MTEVDLIKKCFEDTVGKVYQAFYSEFTGAGSDAAAEAAAEDRFRKGILHARFVRERALASLPPEGAPRPV